MRLRAIVPALVLAALTAGGGAAYADPEDGEGCAGLPGVPATYVCVISVTPANALPSLGGGSSVTVPVPRVCYVAGCVGPTSVDVPVPGAQPGDGAVAVLWYQGSYIPVAAGEVPTVGPLPTPGSVVPYEDIAAAVAAVDEAVADAMVTAEKALYTAERTVRRYLDQVDLPPLIELSCEENAPLCP